MNDIIFVRGIVLYAHHGVLQYEGEIGQRFIIDLELEVDLSQSSRSDKLSDTVSYASIVATATAAFKDRAYKLVEAAAGAVADAVLEAFPKVTAIRITVHKPHAPIAAIFDDAGVTMTRRR